MKKMIIGSLTGEIAFVIALLMFFAGIVGLGDKHWAWGSVLTVVGAAGMGIQLYRAYRHARQFTDCPTCQGTGTLRRICPDCEGKGRIKKVK